MTEMEKRAAARLPMAGTWMRRGESLAKVAKRVLSAFARMRARRQTLSVLYALDDRILQDIGLSRDGVESAVDAMLSRPPRAEEVVTVRDLNAGKAADIAAPGVSNEGHFESAA